MSIKTFTAKVAAGEKLTMITCYDYSFAKIFNGSDIDMLLVGDSVAMTMHGYDGTIPATIDMMATHISAVVRGAPDKHIVGDMPFLSYHSNITTTLNNVKQLMQAGAQSIKLEGGAPHIIKQVNCIVDSGVPVIGHLGLTPQSVHQLGGFKVQAREAQQAAELIEQSKALETAGCYAIVLECIPSELAKQVSDALTIPTIGIGAGVHCDGQVLVMQDVLGLNTDFRPKFVKQYMTGAELVTQAVNAYTQEVKTGTFPSKDHSFK